MKEEGKDEYKYLIVFNHSSDNMKTIIKLCT